MGHKQPKSSKQAVSDDAPVVVGGSKRRLHLPFTKKTTLIVLLIALLVAAAAGGFVLYKYLTYEPKTLNKDQSATEQIWQFNDRDLEQLVKDTQNSDNAADQESRALALAQLGRTDDAQSAYKALADRPDATPEQLGDYAKMAAANNDYTTAISAAEQAIQKIEAATGGARTGEDEDMRVRALKSSIAYWKEEQ